MRALKRISSSQRINTTISSLMAFSASSLLHEIMVYLLIAAPTEFEQALFFLLHAVFCITQVYLEKAGYRIKNKYIKILVTSILFLWTTPFFLNPYEREDIITALCRGWTIIT